VLQQTRWLNFEAFCARLVKAGIELNLIHAINALSDAFERPHFDENDIARLQAPWDVKVNVAAQWVLIAGDELFARNSGLATYVLKEGDDLHPKNCIWQGPYFVFCVERWKLWARGFRDMSTNQMLNSLTRARATEAAASIMGRINCAVERLD